MSLLASIYRLSWSSANHRTSKLSSCHLPSLRRKSVTGWFYFMCTLRMRICVRYFFPRALYLTLKLKFHTPYSQIHRIRCNKRQRAQKYSILLTYIMTMQRPTIPMERLKSRAHDHEPLLTRPGALSRLTAFMLGRGLITELLQWISFNISCEKIIMKLVWKEDSNTLVWRLVLPVNVNNFTNLRLIVHLAIC